MQEFDWLVDLSATMDFFITWVIKKSMVLPSDDAKRHIIAVVYKILSTGIEISVYDSEIKFA